MNLIHAYEYLNLYKDSVKSLIVDMHLLDICIRTTYLHHYSTLRFLFNSNFITNVSSLIELLINTKIRQIAHYTKKSIMYISILLE